ncbi:HWE histidine kinase domain-containing protein [Rubellimicrobium rubrum]|nr:HWE histidine kinase domain-containing protein [Rubellimicrobium rubrum]
MAKEGQTGLEPGEPSGNLFPISAADERLLEVLDRSVAFAALMTPEGVLTQISQHALALTGVQRDEVVGRPVWDMVWWAYDPALPRRIRATVVDAAQGRASRFDVKVQAAGGRRTIIDLQISPRLVATGEVVEIVASAVDVSERVLAQRRLEQLLGDMGHRMKNFLTLVRALARTTERTARSEGAFREFSGRLDALTIAHDALDDTSTAEAYFEQLAHRLLRPYTGADSKRLVISGPPLPLRQNEGRMLALCLYELATNAVKHGALSTLQGRVSVTLTAPHDGMGAMFLWEEQGGPLVRPPTRQGFGSEFVASVLGGIFDAEVRTEYAPQGFRLSVSGPARLLFSDGLALQSAQP